MSNTPEEFEELRKLLRLKRHEQPPPGFFKDFSARVAAGIDKRAPTTWIERLWDEAPWLKRFLHTLESNPLAAGGFATSICALLVGGIVYSQYMDQTPQFVPAAPEGTINAPAPAVPSKYAENSQAVQALLSGSTTSSNLFGSKTPTPFDAVSPTMTPVSFPAPSSAP